MSNQDLEQLIAAWLDGRISAEASEVLQQELRESAEARATFQMFAQLDGAIREVADTESPGSISRAHGSSIPLTKGSKDLYFRGGLAIAAAIVVLLTATLYFNRNTDQTVARITGLNGSLTWIGNGGQIVQDPGSPQAQTRWSNVLSKGAELPGGTIEGMAPDSWFELEFLDGSKGMIFAGAILTFSDQGQKELRLKQGRFSASVVPQPEGKPMLIHTPVAVLEVIGTQFEIEAGPTSAKLHVREGEVEIRRISDGKTVGVPAGHSVVVTANGDMLLRAVAPDQTWAQTPFWENLSISGDQASIATQECSDYDGTRNLLLSEAPATLPAQDTGYTISPDDVFDISYVWRSGSWWTAKDQIAIKLFTTDNDLISGTPTTFATMLSGPTTTVGVYQVGSGSATATATESGKRLFVAIDTKDGAGELEGIAHLDNFQLQVKHFPQQGSTLLEDFQLQKMLFPDQPPKPTAIIMVIGGDVRNGDFNGE